MMSDARRYSQIRYRLMLAEMIGSLIFLWLYQATGVSEWAANWAVAHTDFFEWSLALYLVLFGICSYVVFFPLHLYSGFVLEHRFGLSRMSLAQWGVREIKQLLLSGLFGLMLVEGLYAILRGVPRAWPAIATLAWVGVSVVVARIFPTVLVPLFYKTVPLGDAPLVARLLALCEQAGLKALGVFRVDLGVETRKANAALAGLGRSRRVLLSDTLLERFSPEEIETVLGHELGHQRYRHIMKFLVLSGIGSLLAFSTIAAIYRWWMEPLWSESLTDPAGFPLLMLWLSLIGLIGLPLQSGISRAFEWQADRFAVTLTHAPSAFASALKKLGDLNLADPHPPRWVVWLFYDHPPIAERITAAERATASASSF